MRPLWFIALTLFACSETPGQPSTAKTLTLTREIRMGANDDGAGELRGFVSPKVAPNGDVYAYSGCEIFHFGSSGKYVGHIGRCGDGPGEFRGISAMGFLDDTIWVSDGTHRNVTLLTPGRGAPVTLAVTYVPTHRELKPSSPEGMLRGGAFIAAGYLPFGRNDNAIPEPVPIISPLVRLSRNGKSADTIATLRVRNSTNIRVNFRDTFRGIAAQPFDIVSRWAARPDGKGFVVIDVPLTVTAQDAHFTLNVFDQNGNRSASVRQSFTPLVITAQTRDRVFNEIAAGFVHTKDSAVFNLATAELARQLREKVVVPKFESPVSHVIAGNDGSVWVLGERYAPGQSYWTAYDSKGNVFGRLLQPKNFRIAYADLQQVIGVETDGDGIPWIVRMRVNR